MHPIFGKLRHDIGIERGKPFFLNEDEGLSGTMLRSKANQLDALVVAGPSKNKIALSR